MPANGADYGLKTLEKGVPPECRMESAISCQNFIQSLVDDDQKRSRVRSLVNGLVDGNAPYRPSALIAANRRDACNVNFGTGRSTLEAGVGAFYDLINEAPGTVQITTSHGNDENRIEWSRTMSEYADLAFRENKAWDSQVQTSQTETVLHGKGPMFFEDAHGVFPRAIGDGDLYVPDRTQSDVDRWEIAAVLFEYYPPELYEFIKNESSAAKVGWDVEYTKNVIEHAMDQKQPDQRTYTWEWFQNEIKTNSFNYLARINVCKLAHVFWREFNGRVTHAIVERQDNTSKGVKYLFLSVGRFESFYEVIHPMYFDKGRQGLHHNVTGLGTKQYAPLEYENRLLCNLMDKAFAPKTLFKPTSAEAGQKFQMARFGDYATVPNGTEVLQTPIQGFLTDGLAMFRTSMELMRSNLSQYRQTVQPERPGNPETALGRRMDAQQQSSLSNTTFSRYYNQLDCLYSEIVRRLCNLNTTDKVAKKFQERCEKAGVPEEAFGSVESVKAVRVVGQGSPFLRAQVTSDMLPIMGRLPETGQQNLLDDFIASRAGQSAVTRYAPRSKVSLVSGDQKERAGNQIVGMKNGKPADFSPSQDALIFAGAYLHAASESIASIRKGANPQQVLAFVELAAPAAITHIRRMGGDPFRQQFAAVFEKQIKQLGGMVDKLKKALSDQAKKAQAQRGKTQDAMTDAQLKEFKVRHDAKLKEVKTAAKLKTDAVRTRQGLALNDARTSSEIALNHFRALNE